MHFVYCLTDLYLDLYTKLVYLYTDYTKFVYRFVYNVNCFFMYSVRYYCSILIRHYPAFSAISLFSTCCIVRLLLTSYIYILCNYFLQLFFTIFYSVQLVYLLLGINDLHVIRITFRNYSTEPIPLTSIMYLCTVHNNYSTQVIQYTLITK